MATESRRLEIEDWARVLSFSPSLYFKPANRDELKSFLQGILRGFAGAKSVRTLGSLHSCSDIYVSDAIVDVSGMSENNEFSLVGDTVTASANWKLHDFLLELSRHGKSLSATGGTDEQTLAGLISTNTAPATPKYAMYDRLEWVEYITVDDDGQTIVEKHVSKDDPEFPAVVCSLGAIGILTRVQFRVVDELFFQTVQKIMPLDDVLGDVDATSRDYDFWRIDWIPETSRGLLWAAKQVPRDQADPNGDYKEDEVENILKGVFLFWDKLSKDTGPLLDDTMKWVYRLIAGLYNLDEPKPSGPLRNMLPVDRRAPLHVAMAEWSFNPQDLNAVRRLCEAYYEQNGWPNLPIEIELSKTDRYLMSPWNWPGMDYIVKFNFMYLTDVCKTDQEKQQIVTHLQGLWQRLTQAAIPFKAHWGKINFMDNRFIRENYRLDQFQPFIRSMFLNDYLTKRLRG